MFIDSHAHIEADRFDEDREAVIERALAAGIELLVNVGNGDVAGDSHQAAFEIADKHSFIYTTVGVHPHEARLLNAELFAKLLDWAKHPKVIAWGEIGLDYYYDNSPREVQRAAFRRQLQAARDRNLPVVIHTRDAEADTLAILNEEWQDANLPGIIHCFTGTRRFAEKAVELGFLISFSGVVTFKNAEDLRETARALPMEKLLIETDSPFLAPVPYRGKRNEPAFVVEVAKTLAAIRELTTQEVGRRTTENFKNLFRMA
ncbi:MAG: TatD family hydrolase [Acidobacteriota bacterium]